MTNVRKKIIVPHGMHQEIARKLKAHRNTVRYALAGETDTPKARVIRAMALEMLKDLNK